MDIRAGASWSSPEQFVLLANGTILFVATTSAGAEVMRTDGTAACTALVGEIVPGTQGGQIEDMTAVGNLAYFTAITATSGRELWVTDGTTLTQVRDIYPGAPSGVLVGTLRARTGSNEVVFGASDGNDGLQIWGSDGTFAGTHQVGKIGPWSGSGAVDLGDFTTINGDTWFACDDGILGREPWIITLNGPVAAVTTYGTGCGPVGGLVPSISGVGLPQLGNSGFAIAMSNGLPFSVGLVAAGFAPTNIQVGYCRILVAPPIVILPTALLDATGATSTPVPIPSTPALAGAMLYGQYLAIDPNGRFYGFGSLSNGIAMLLGN